MASTALFSLFLSPLPASALIASRKSFLLPRSTRLMKFQKSPQNTSAWRIALAKHKLPLLIRPRGTGGAGEWTCEIGRERRPERVEAADGSSAAPLMPASDVEAEMGDMPFDRVTGTVPAGGRTRSAHERLTGAAAGAGDFGVAGAAAGGIVGSPAGCAAAWLGVAGSTG